MRKVTYVILLLALILGVVVTAALADGTEQLGAPSIAIADGTGIAVGGTGLVSQPGTIDVEVPAGATVKQVLLYWSGEFKFVNDDTIAINGSDVTGTLIGGPTFFFVAGGQDVYGVSYRADITDRNLIAAGPNSLTVDGMSFDHHNHGAGVLVIYEMAGEAAELAIVDGSDLAFFRFAPPLDTTVPQTFNFAPADMERFAELNIFSGSVGANRPNAITLETGGVVTTLINPLGSSDGPLWDTARIQVAIPAGASSLTVQVLSQSDGSGNLPASLNWVGASLAVPVEVFDEGEGCTPGFWRNHFEDWPPTGYSPSDDFDTTFGVDYFDPDITLGDAIWLGGGGVNKIARHGTAALLNASSPDVEYPLTVAEVIAAVQAGDLGDIVEYNELLAEGFCD
jgi:hypothetical protein